jgi:two-component system NtrC family sensor kinase
MSASIPQFLICLVLSQQLMRFSRINNLPRWEKFFKNALIFTIFLIIAEASLSAANTVRWIWYAFIIVLVSYPLRQKEFRPLYNYVMAFAPYVLVSLTSDLINLIIPDFFHSWINYFSTARLLALIWLVAILFNQSRQRKAAEKERIKRQKEDELNRAIAIRKVELEANTC